MLMSEVCKLLAACTREVLKRTVLVSSGKVRLLLYTTYLEEVYK